MTSPFEEVAAELNQQAKLPADNWLRRRIESMRGHQEGMLATIRAIIIMGETVLQNRISTNLRIQGAADLETVKPTKDVAELKFGILPTGVRGGWQGHGLWTPDAAMAVGLRLTDEYDNSNRSLGPRPLGKVSLTMSARTWGELAEDEEARINDIEGVWVEYGDNGYCRRGTTVQVRREAGQALRQEEIETVLAPLSKHIINFFSLTDHPRPNPQPPGNFTWQSENVPSYSKPKPIRLAEIVAASRAVLSGEQQAFNE